MRAAWWLWVLCLGACGSDQGLTGGNGGASPEVCGNGIDDDDDGLVDCSDPVCAAASCAEACGDGIDNNLDGLIDCDDRGCDGHCPEVCGDDRDNDGDTRIDCFDAECADLCDVDRDGAFNASVGGDDCDDADNDVFPDAIEVCDGRDNDCDGLADEDDPSLDLSTQSRWYADNDLDGYGWDGPGGSIGCEPEGDEVGNPDDCADTDADRNPAATEICNDLDDDCDGLVDDGDPTLDPATQSAWYLDSDRDGLGDSATMVMACRAPPGHVDNGDDCDDTSAERLGPSLWVADGDGDGFGTGPAIGPLGCVPPPGFGPSNVLDCDDSDGDVFPGAVEVCGDRVDSDCDTLDCRDWSDDFEQGSPLGPDWSSSGNANWLVQSGQVHAGGFAAASGNIGDNQVSHMTVTLDYTTGGTIAFWHSGSTESNYDYLQFFIDGALQDEWSGSWSWTQTSYPVSAGIHQLKWTYTKDFSVSTGADTVYVDDVLAAGGYP